MSTTTHLLASRRYARAVVPALLVCALVLLSGCLAVPGGQTPGAGILPAGGTRLVPESETLGGTIVATSRPAASSAAPGGIGTPEPRTPGASGATAVPSVKTSASCEPSDSPDVFAMGTPEAGAVTLPPICITGFLPDTEVELWVTDPDSQSESSSKMMGQDGTATVDWSAEAGLLTGTYMFEATQGDLRAIGSVEVGPGAETLEPTAEPQEGGPWIEVYPVGDSGWDFEVVLGGFEPLQEVPLTLYVATDEMVTEFQEIDSLSEQVDDQGGATFPLELTPGEYPSSWFVLSYLLEDGSPVYAQFQVE